MMQEERQTHAGTTENATKIIRSYLSVWLRGSQALSVDAVDLRGCLRGHPASPAS